MSRIRFDIKHMLSLNLEGDISATLGPLWQIYEFDTVKVHISDFFVTEDKKKRLTEQTGNFVQFDQGGHHNLKTLQV